MKNLIKLLVVLTGCSVSLIAASGEATAQKKGKKKKNVHGESCIGKGECGKTKAGKMLEGQYRVW